MKHFIQSIILFFYISVSGQTNVAKNLPDIDTLFLPKLTGDFFYESKKYVGDQYYNNDWVKGDILLSTGEMIYDKTLKYNGLFDELIWLNTNNYGKFKLDKSFIKEFWLKNIQDSAIHFKQISVLNTTSSIQQDIFVEVALQGKMSLFIQRKISVMGSQTIFKDNVLKLYEYVYKTPIYYIKTPSGAYLNLSKIRSKEFSNLFAENKKLIQKHIRTKHLIVRTESDLLTLIKSLNDSKIY